MIPPLVDGVLPEGIHDCTIDEIEQMFGRFRRSDRRIRLMEKLKAYLIEAKSVSFIRVSTRKTFEPNLPTCKRGKNKTCVVEDTIREKVLPLLRTAIPTAEQEALAQGKIPSPEWATAMQIAEHGGVGAERSVR